MGNNRQLGKSRQKHRRQPQPQTRPGTTRRPDSGRAPTSRYPGRNKPGRREMPQRTPAQTARLWIISLCGAVPGAVVVYLTQNFFAGAAVFLAVVMVLGFIVYLYEKRKKQ